VFDLYLVVFSCLIFFRCKFFSITQAICCLRRLPSKWEKRRVGIVKHPHSPPPPYCVSWLVHSDWLNMCIVSGWSRCDVSTMTTHIHRPILLPVRRYVTALRQHRLMTSPVSASQTRPGRCPSVCLSHAEAVSTSLRVTGGTTESQASADVWYVVNCWLWLSLTATLFFSREFHLFGKKIINVPLNTNISSTKGKADKWDNAKKMRTRWVLSPN